MDQKLIALKEKQKLEIEVASLALRDIPKTYAECGRLIWDAFTLGRRQKEFELLETGALGTGSPNKERG